MDTDRKNGIVRVAIYGRVSTQHEAQLSAFENQQQWYEDYAKTHPEWLIVARYYDEGITGTAARKRPKFMQMIEAAKQRRFDVIITREVCRFARNTVDALEYVRLLKNLNIEVIFINDGISSMSSDGELRLSIFATLAQDESRKVSERVLAGQKISRDNHTLYGNGNILGYTRVGKTYEIEPEQAETVRTIYKLYSQGLGFKKICGELMALGCKNASGEVNWTVSNVSRIVRNATYKGCICYNKSHSDNYLSQKRINHRYDDYEYVKGDFEPIVSEELWDQCEAIRLKRTVALQDQMSGTVRKPRKEPKSVYVDKMRCSCGSSFHRIPWRQNENGEWQYGFECWRRKRYASEKSLREHGLDPTVVCTKKSIPYWQIDLMAVKVFHQVWNDRKDAVLLACQLLEECLTKDSDNYQRIIDTNQSKVNRLRKKQIGLREMCAEGLITKAEFIGDNERIKSEIAELESQILELKNASEGKDRNDGFNMNLVRKKLEEWTDFSAITIPDSVVAQFILQIVVVDENTYNWTLDLTNSQDESRLSATQIALQMYRDKTREEKRVRNEYNSYDDSLLSEHIINPTELFRFVISAKEAEEYCHSRGLKFFHKKWIDKTVIVSI